MILGLNVVNLDNEGDHDTKPNVVELDEDVNCKDIGLEKYFEKRQGWGRE